MPPDQNRSRMIDRCPEKHHLSPPRNRPAVLAAMFPIRHRLKVRNDAEEFTIEKVINRSFSPLSMRLDIDFGVFYGPDPHEIIKLAVESRGTDDRMNSSPATRLLNDRVR